MQKRDENAGAAYSMPQCSTRYERGNETVMIQTYAQGVRLIVNLDTGRSRLMVGDRLLDIYEGTDTEKMRRMTATAESVSKAMTRRKSPDHGRRLS